MQKDNVKPPLVHCVNDESDFVVPSEKTSAQNHFSSPQPSHYLYEPNASMMKAGCFDAVATAFSLQQLAPNSHLFTSDQQVTDFPGRSFQIESISSMNKQDLKKLSQSIHQANVATRNFPMSVAELRKKLKLGDGGETYIFATTLGEEKRIFIICKKLNSVNSH